MKFKKSKKERRKHDRYGAETKVNFRVTYDFKAKIKYVIIDKWEEKILSKVYMGVSKDFSVEGLCFTSPQKLEQGDNLRLEVFVPHKKEPVIMDGEVRWSERKPLTEKGEILYDTGIRLSTINKKTVQDTVRFDQALKVAWSDVLESVAGVFKSGPVEK